jgi:hypothetical protein
MLFSEMAMTIKDILSGFIISPLSAGYGAVLLSWFWAA